MNFKKKKKLLQQNQVIIVSDGKKALFLNSFSYETGKTFSDKSYRNISVCCMNQSLLLLMCQYLHYYQNNYCCYKVCNFMFNSYLCTCRAKIFVKGYYLWIGKRWWQVHKINKIKTSQCLCEEVLFCWNCHWFSFFKFVLFFGLCICVSVYNWKRYTLKFPKILIR